MEENRRWKAKWIWADPLDVGDRVALETVLFRKSFKVLNPNNSRIQLSISADSRYRLFLNGDPVCSGPCKGDQNTHYYETIILENGLLQGENILSAQVVHYPNSRIAGTWRGPASVWRSDQGGFLVEGNLESGDGRCLEVLDTGSEWKTYRVQGDAFALTVETFTLFIGGGERVDGNLQPYGWQTADYPDEAWSNATIVANAYDPTYGELSRWLLTPRPIPLMSEELHTFSRVVRANDSHRIPAIDTSWSITVPPGERLWLEWDAGRIVAGYPRLELSGGKDAFVSMLYSECYEYPPGPDGKRNKGVRDDPEDKALYGFTDEYRVRGGGGAPPEVYEPFHRRAFRFIRLEVEAADEPLTIRNFSYRRTGYPLQVGADFACSDESLHPLWEISLNTLRNCMHETYEDTPYYEQMGYEMDSRLQILFTYKVSGDDRLAKKVIHDFHSTASIVGK